MQAGKLRNRVELQSRTLTRDSFGDFVQNWGTMDTVWGAIEQSGGRELWVARSKNPNVDTVVTIRYYLPGLSPIERIKFGERIFNVTGVVSADTKKREMVVSCIEEV